MSYESAPLYPGDDERLTFVVAGGGSGASNLMAGFREVVMASDDPAVANARLVEITTVTDDGGSTGRLAAEHGTQPVGDLRRGLSALTPDSRVASIIEQRFGNVDPEDIVAAGTALIVRQVQQGHDFDVEFAGHLVHQAAELTTNPVGHNLGNLMLTAAIHELGTLREASAAVGGIMGARGEVLPVSSVNPQRLVLLDRDPQTGQVIVTIGEDNIDGLEKIHSPLDARVGFTTSQEATPENPMLVEVPADHHVLDIVTNSDAFVTGQGSWLTSVLPTLEAGGMREAIATSKGVRVLVPNLVTQIETEGMTVKDFYDRGVTAMGGVDALVYNEDLSTLKELGYAPVVYTPEEIEALRRENVKVLGLELASAALRQADKNDALGAHRSKVVTRSADVARRIIEMSVARRRAGDRELVVA